MRRIYCDCCSREIFETEQLFNLEINKGQDKEIILDDMCTDCYEEIKRTMEYLKRGQ